MLAVNPVMLLIKETEFYLNLKIDKLQVVSSELK